MNVIDYCQKHGRIQTLKALGENQLAFDLEKAENYEQTVVDKEGIIPFYERPKATQLKLNAVNKIYRKADDLIWKNRKVHLNLEEE